MSIKVSTRSLFLVSLLSCLLLGSAAVRAQEIPRLPNGLPDFNGIWQVMNEANWDLEQSLSL